MSIEFHEGPLPDSVIEKQRSAPFLILDDGTVIEQKMYSGGASDRLPFVGSIVVTSLDTGEN